LLGAPQEGTGPGKAPALRLQQGPHTYGSERPFLMRLPGADHWLAPGLSEAMVRFAARYEYATSVEDVLARRSRMLFLDAPLAAHLAPQVAEILQSELGGDTRLAEFIALSAHFSNVP
jgi:glycerol-3-phosphate dehydrogenase